MPRCQNDKCGAALIYEPEFLDTPARWICMAFGWMRSDPNFRTTQVFSYGISGLVDRLKKGTSGIRLVLPPKRRCATAHQRELFQGISEEGSEGAGDLGARNDRLQHIGVAGVVG